MTVNQIRLLVDDFEQATDHLVSYVKPNGVYCGRNRDRDRQHGYCTCCAHRQTDIAVYWAKKTFRLLRKLQAVADASEAVAL